MAFIVHQTVVSASGKTGQEAKLDGGSVLNGVVREGHTEEVTLE